MTTAPNVIEVKPFGSCQHGEHEACKGHNYNPSFPTEWTGKGAERVVTERGRRHLCSCPCHAGNDLPCLRCNAVGFELQNATGTCVDFEGCEERYQQMLLDSPSYQAGLVARARSAEIRRQVAAQRGDEGDGDRPVTRRGRGEPRPTSGRCEHCGEPTKGGKFAPGHDAKLKGWLKQCAEGGDLDAIVELLKRDWPTHTLKVPDAMMKKAHRVLDSTNGEWLVERVAERIGANA